MKYCICFLLLCARAQAAPALLFSVIGAFSPHTAPSYTYTITASGVPLSAALSAQDMRVIHYDAADIPEFVNAIHSNPTLTQTVNDSSLTLPGDQYHNLAITTIQYLELTPLVISYSGTYTDVGVALQGYGIVPEPGLAALIGIALGASIGCRRRPS